MKTATRPPVPGYSARINYEELRSVLEQRRTELDRSLHTRMREVRTDHSLHVEHEGAEDGAISVLDIQEDIELALAQMQAETLGRIDLALERMDDGTFGYCSSCGRHIGMVRLRAMPFAIRCRDCQERQEIESRSGRSADRTGAHPWLATADVRETS